MNQPSWCCQRCGAEIGWLGRAQQALGIPIHTCTDGARILYIRGWWFVAAFLAYCWL